MPTINAPGRVSPANHLLASLPAEECDRLLACCAPVALAGKAVLYRPGEPLSHVYFPTSGVLSLVAVTRAEGSVQVGMIGREGLAGLPVLLGTGTDFARCEVQVPGQALLMRAAVFQSQVSSGSPLRRLLLRYTHALLAQLAQLIVCNALHPLGQRYCRALLMIHDRAASDQFPLTHERLAALLGVRRAGVTEAARRAQGMGLIRYAQGQVTVLDRAGLEAAACECHGALHAGFGRVLS
jgi:CRP-like cAMP-binding protein